MAKLVFRSGTSPAWDRNVEVDTANVLAVKNLGFVALDRGEFAHCRGVYYKDGTAISVRTLWELSSSRTVPSTMATLETWVVSHRLNLQQWPHMVPPMHRH